jgi:hypothetical protein
MTVMYPTCKVVAARDFSVPKLIDMRFEAPKSGVMLLVEQVQIMNLNAKNNIQLDAMRAFLSQASNERICPRVRPVSIC